MFGMSFGEVLIILIIAVLFLGPDKLPSVIVQVAKFFRTFKQSINEAKSSIEQEIRLDELKKETQEYKKSFEESKENMRKKLTLDELDELKNAKKDITDAISSLKDETFMEKK